MHPTCTLMQSHKEAQQTIIIYGMRCLHVLSPTIHIQQCHSHTAGEPHRATCHLLVLQGVRGNHALVCGQAFCCPGAAPERKVSLLAACY